MPQPKPYSAWLGAIIPLLALAFWEFEGLVGALPRYLPPPSAIGRELIAMLASGELFVHAAAQVADNQERTLSDIMMSQDFQDLSGQVIKKVIDIISRTENQLLQLLKDTAPEHVIAAVAAAQAETLQGPQTGDKAMKQDDVDDLLAQMGF